MKVLSTQNVEHKVRAYRRGEFFALTDPLPKDAGIFGDKYVVTHINTGLAAARIRTGRLPDAVETWRKVERLAKRRKRLFAESDRTELAKKIATLHSQKDPVVLGIKSIHDACRDA